MAKQLKVSNITSLHAKEFAMRPIIVTTSDNQEFEVQIQEKINDTTIMELISELTERSNYCKKNDIEFNPILNTYVLLIKYFTNIKFNNYKAIEKQLSHEISIINKLLDLNLFTQIVSHFDKETMDKIQEAFGTYAKQTNIITNNIMIENLKRQVDDVEVVIDEEEL